MIVAGPGATRRSEFVRQDNNAAAQRLATGQGEFGQRAFSGQQVIRVAAADEERMDPQSELVQQATFQQGVGELRHALFITAALDAGSAARRAGSCLACRSARNYEV
jgi:hypothetical protein